MRFAGARTVDATQTRHAGEFLNQNNSRRKLGNLPVAAPAKDVLEPRFVDRALAKLGSYQAK